MNIRQTFHAIVCKCLDHLILRTERYGHMVYLSAGSLEGHFWISHACQFCLVVAIVHEVRIFITKDESE